MKLYRFDKQTSRVITKYDSHNATVSHLLESDTTLSIVCIYLGAGGILGGHPAVSNQLFLVVSGEGWFTSEEGETIELKQGMAVFWDAGEWHESGSHNGMMAIVIEGEEIDPSQFMTELS